MPTPRSVEVGLSPLTAINAASRGISRPRSAKAPLISERDKPRRNVRPHIYYRPGSRIESIGRWTTLGGAVLHRGAPDGRPSGNGPGRRRAPETGRRLAGAPEQEREQPHDEGRARARGGKDQRPPP